MQRVIKFRAWHRPTQKMHEVVAYCCAGGEKGDVEVKDESYRYLQAKDIEVMQFTGLQDRNGKDIYEGDIVESLLWGSEGRHYREAVEWDENIIGFQPFCEYDVDCDGHPTAEALSQEYLVIGNIYEHPELLHK